jgi:hypothetical protein
MHISWVDYELSKINLARSVFLSFVIISLYYLGLYDLYHIFLLTGLLCVLYCWVMVLYNISDALKSKS